MSVEHETTNIIIQNLASIVTGAVVILLLALRHLGKQKTADLAKEVVQEKTVTHDYVDARLANAHLEIVKNINKDLDDFRRELMSEVKALHARINNE